jgi:hypothetical protein
MTPRNNAICPPVVSSQLNPSAYARVAVRAGKFAKRVRTAPAMPLGVFCSMSTPDAGVFTTSGFPQMLEAITGVPHAIASRSTFAQPSRLDARTRASAAPYTSGSIVCGLEPRKRTDPATSTRRCKVT